MKRWIAAFCLAGLLSTLSPATRSPVCADEVVPEQPPKSVMLPLRVGYRKGLEGPSVFIPKPMVRRLKLTQAGPQAEWEQAGVDSRALLAGCALGAAVCGLALVRRQRTAVAAGALLLACGFGAFGLDGGASFADAEKEKKELNKTIHIEFQAGGDAVTLVLPAVE